MANATWWRVELFSEIKLCAHRMHILRLSFIYYYMRVVVRRRGVAVTDYYNSGGSNKVFLMFYMFVFVLHCCKFNVLYVLLRTHIHREKSWLSRAHSHFSDRENKLVFYKVPLWLYDFTQATWRAPCKMCVENKKKITKFMHEHGRINVHLWEGDNMNVECICVCVYKRQMVFVWWCDRRRIAPLWLPQYALRCAAFRKTGVLAAVHDMFLIFIYLYYTIFIF